MKRYAAGAIAALALGALGFALAPRDNVEGIVIYGTLYNRQSIVENYSYRRLVMSTLEGEGDALAKLIQSDCGGGAGCYDHGIVLAQILVRSGEPQFIQMSQSLTGMEKSELSSFLEAGFEYGASLTNRSPDFGKNFPKLSKALNKS